MKLLRHGPVGQERPGLLDKDGNIRDLSGVIDDIAGKVLSPQGLAMLAALDPKSLPMVSKDARLGPCVGGVGKIIAVGLNYADHAKEAGLEPPREPVLFAKAVTSLCGPNDDVIQPKGSTKLDWEVELTIVIGSRARYVSEADAMSHVAGFCVMNDVSERAFQIESTGQWIKGKSHDTFAPLGPWLVTRDEIADAGKLDMFLEVNGTMRQKGSTATMIFGVAHLVSYISQFMTLEPGDVIPTGTPPGVGLGHKPPLFLKPGDTMRLGIHGLGEQRQRVVVCE
ncbi:MAG: fumarylacetoacetate hydrolase family protein [Hyphomicrobiaceae bacterium]|nr:fumarylacetoacetate hydrolase family protein [Hyphomicrobiaceae bacterium]